MPSPDKKFSGLIGVPAPLPDDDEPPEATPPHPGPTAIEPEEFARPRGLIEGSGRRGEAREFARPRRPRRQRSRISAHEAVINARISSRREPQAWVRYTTQLPDNLCARLARRLVRDREASGDLQLGLQHYLNVAFSRAPQSPLEDWFPPEDREEMAAWVPPEEVQWALEWRVRGRTGRRLTRTGSQLHEDVALAMNQLAGRLKIPLPQRVWVWEVQAEALARLLNELDADQPGG